MTQVSRRSFFGGAAATAMAPLPDREHKPRDFRQLLRDAADLIEQSGWKRIPPYDPLAYPMRLTGYTVNEAIEKIGDEYSKRENLNALLHMDHYVEVTFNRKGSGVPADVGSAMGIGAWNDSYCPSCTVAVASLRAAAAMRDTSSWAVQR